MFAPALAAFVLASTPDAAARLDDVPIAETARVKPATVTPRMVQVAETFLHLPLGSERFARIDGRPLAFVLERHYHPEGTPNAPSGWHKGVTVYELR